MVEKFFAFLQSVFSEDDGQGSYSRVASGAIVVATLAWVSHVVWKTGALPDLTGPATFICLAAGSHYGINKASDIISAFKGNQPPQQ